MLCGIVLMGILSYDMIPAQAAECSHKFRYVTFEDEKEYQYEEDGHYVIIGTSYTCADCGDKYWEDLEREWVEAHQWSSVYICIEESDELDIYECLCTTPGCTMARYRYYYK